MVFRVLYISLLFRELKSICSSSASFSLIISRIVSSSNTYFEMLRELPEGLSEWGLRPAEGAAEMRGMTIFWPIRDADYKFCVSDRSKTIIQEEVIQIMSHTKLQELRH